MALYREAPQYIRAFQYGYDRPPSWWKEAVDSDKAYVRHWEGHDGEKGSAGVIYRGAVQLYAQKGDYITCDHVGNLDRIFREDFEHAYEYIEEEV